MSQIVASNGFLLARMNATRAALNLGRFLYLYINDFTPGPETVLGDFDEATFPGYGPIDLGALFSTPIKVREGEYVSIVPNQSWLCTGPAFETVYGWYIRNGLLVELSSRLDTPVPVQNGTEVIVGINFIERATSIPG